MNKILMLGLLFTVLAFTSASGSAQPTVQESIVTSRAPKLKLTRTQGSNPIRGGSMWAPG